MATTLFAYEVIRKKRAFGWKTWKGATTNKRKNYPSRFSLWARCKWFAPDDATNEAIMKPWSKSVQNDLGAFGACRKPTGICSAQRLLVSGEMQFYLG